MKKFFIFGRYPVEDILKKEDVLPAIRDNFCALISLIDAQGETSPFETAGLKDLPNLHIAKFMDINDEEANENPDLARWAPQKDQVETIITFLKEKLQTRGRVLIHCHMGYSRSPAVGIIAAFLLVKDAEEAVRFIMEEVAIQVHPNPRILRLADEILGLPPASGLMAESEAMFLAQKKA